jgi:DNA-binding HxlR family transcriptional regulator
MDAVDVHAHTGADAGPPAPAEADGPSAAMGEMAGVPIGVRPCSIAAALEILGERWSLLAVREMAYGVHTFARIAGFTGASRDILADRLRKLERAGVIERRPYSEHPPRFEYHLTRAGLELFPLMMALREWGDRWAVDVPAVEFRHTCGEQVRLEMRCEHCGDPVTRDSLTPSRTR